MIKCQIKCHAYMSGKKFKPQRTTKFLPWCHLFQLLSSKCAHTQSDSLLPHCYRGINTTSKSAAATHAEPKMISSTGRLHVHSRDLSLQDQLLILPLCDGKDIVLTSHRAWHLLRHEMQRKKDPQHQQGDTHQCKTHSRVEVFRTGAV